jgi:cell pole-organizing protein PopZ
MSSFDKTAGKNLDEILASIRKTLADETPHPEANPGEPAPANAKAAASENHNGSKALAGKIDEDLADLLAGGLGVQAAAPKTAETSGAAADPKDPLWFLRPSGGGESQVLPLPADRVTPSFEALANGPADPALERSSLAPLFVADTGGGQPSAAATGLTPPAQGIDAPGAAPAPEPIAPIEAKSAAKDTVASPRASKEGSGEATLPEVAGRPNAIKASAPAPTGAMSAPKSEAAKPSAPAAATPVAGPAAAPLKSPGTGQPQAAATTVPNPLRPAEPAKPAAAAAAARAALANNVGLPLNGGPRASALNGAAPRVASPSEAANATVAPTGQTQALEQIIEQLLEPLLRRWVEANLPRLVDAAIRAEVARALDAKRVIGQDADRKV